MHILNLGVSLRCLKSWRLISRSCLQNAEMMENTENPIVKTVDVVEYTYMNLLATSSHSEYTAQTTYHVQKGAQIPIAF
jgi:hypothetical protein